MRYILVCVVASVCITTFGMDFNNIKNYNSELSVRHLNQEITELEKKCETLRKQKENFNFDIKNRELNHTIALKKKDDQIDKLQRELQKTKTEAVTLFSAVNLLVKNEEKMLARTNSCRLTFRDSMVMLLALCMFIGIQELQSWVSN